MTLPETLEWAARTTLAVIALAIIFSIHRNRLAASIQFSLWFCCGGLLVGSFFVAGVLPDWNVIPRFGEAEERRFIPVASDGDLSLPVEIESSQSAANEKANSGNAFTQQVTFSLWGLVWATGSVVLLIRLILSYCYLSRQKQILSDDHPAYGLLENLKSAFDIRKSVKLVEGPGSPMTWGVARPVISLPANCDEWKVERLSMVLRHELAHVARRDALWLLVSQVVLSLFWFHPGLWYISNRLRESREQAADALVLRQGVVGADYAEVILSFMGMPRSKGVAVALCGIKSQGSFGGAGRRIKAVLNGQSARTVSDAMRFGLALLVVVSIGVVTASVSAQPVKRDLKTVVILDAGHGGLDSGAKGKLGMEKDYNLDVTVRVKDLLEARGIETVLTRSDDRYLTLGERIQITRKYQDAILLSIHHNSGRNEKLEGIEVYHPEGNEQRELESVRIAVSLLSAVVKKTGGKNRGRKISKGNMIRNSMIPSVSLECGFVTNLEESVKIDSEAYRQKMAEGIAEGILDYFSIAGDENRKVKQVVPVLKPSLDSLPFADGFDFPVGTPNGTGYYVYRGFESDGHLGEDWNGISGGNNDLGDPVFSIGNGKIVLARDLAGGWGNVIIIRHKYRSKEGREEVVDSFYAHLDRIDVKEGDEVEKRQQIGTIGRGPRNMYAAHLHFEIRKNIKIGMERSMFEKTYANYHSPRQFIKAHRQIPTGL